MEWELLNLIYSTLKQGKKDNKKLITEEKIVKHFQEKIDTFLEYELSILEKQTEKKISTVLADDKNNRTTNNKSYLYILADNETKKELLNKIKFNDNEKDVINKTREFARRIAGQDDSANKYYCRKIKE